MTPLAFSFLSGERLGRGAQSSLSPWAAPELGVPSFVGDVPRPLQGLLCAPLQVLMGCILVADGMGMGRKSRTQGKRSGPTWEISALWRRLQPLPGRPE